ncbi:MAG: 16S rRNA (cytosine(967)-C(5))-methyltransferase RsmB, partial [Nitrococcus sp.]|nr:16S rRNA (cytosine(967)-C(5))-methyltransferase RsmB [Nitrococcus sp.]
MVTSPRQAAVQTLQRVLLRGRNLPDALAPSLAALQDARDRALCQELSYGVLRWHSRLQALVLALLEQRPRSRDRDLVLLLELGLYQLLYTDMPPHAAVSATVDTVRALGKHWAARWVNAVLRRFQRERVDRLERVDGDVATRYAMPPWLLQQLSGDWPEQWESLVQASNARAPLTVRVNRRRSDREAWLARLEPISLAGSSITGLPHAVVLSRALPVAELPGFAGGEVSVQDAGAQFAAMISALKPGQRVLDACAAPGGKAAHILEQAEVMLTALDIDARRLARVAENLERLGLQAKLQVGDAADPTSWWDGRAFDRIVVDAPCSGTGV